MLVVVIFPSMDNHIVIVLITQLVESCFLPTVRVVTEVTVPHPELFPFFTIANVVNCTPPLGCVV